MSRRAVRSQIPRHGEQPAPHRRARRSLAALAATLAALALTFAAPATAQNGEIVRLTISVAPVVATGAPIPVTVTIDADQGALSQRSDHLQLRVRYAAECAGTFTGTPGPVAIDTQIPDPAGANTAYHATLHGSASVAALGTYSVCAYLLEQGTGRLFAQDSDTQFRATSACTDASRGDARVVAALRTARRQLKHAHGARRAALRRKIARLLAQQQATANSLQSACS
jgi:hypothetical protein